MECGVGGMGALSMEVGIPGGAGDGGAGDTGQVAYTWPPPAPPIVTDPNWIDLGDGIGGSLCCHPQRLGHRGLALILMCVLGFGSYFCFDNPGALQVF